MSERTRLLLLIVFEIVWQVLNVVVGREWLDESWRGVAEMGAFFLVMLIVFEVARRRREHRASAARR
jgi:hypothetical protein